MNLTYDLIPGGYTIKKDGIDWIVQTEYIPFPADSMSQSAKLHIEDILKGLDQKQKEVVKVEDLQKQIDFLNQAIAELTMLIVK